MLIIINKTRVETGVIRRPLYLVNNDYVTHCFEINVKLVQRLIELEPTKISFQCRNCFLL